MTDLEITRLCAEAMGLRYELNSDKAEYHDAVCLYEEGSNLWKKTYNPLWDDAQAMALVKKFHIALGWNDPGWGAFGQHDKRWVNNNDLNRAICECVAKMLAAK